MIHNQIGLWRIRKTPVGLEYQYAIEKALRWDDDVYTKTLHTAISEALIRAVLYGLPEVAMRGVEPAREVIPLGQVAQHILSAELRDDIDLLAGDRVIGKLDALWRYELPKAVAIVAVALDKHAVYACRWVETFSNPRGAAQVLEHAAGAVVRIRTMFGAEYYFFSRLDDALAFARGDE